MLNLLSKVLTYLLSLLVAMSVCGSLFSQAGTRTCNIVVNVNATEPSCYGACDGAASAIVTGGVAPYSYLWSTGETTATISNLCAGTYNVTVSDSQGCESATSETTTSCFRITDIMFNSCGGSDEGFNEMVTLISGPNPLNISDMDITWATASVSFQGFCTNPSMIAEINAAITGGGQLVGLDPNGQIPANSEVLIITSAQHFQWNLFDFSALNRTVYVLFQCNDDVITGHFSNNNGRNFTISFGNSCSETVYYAPQSNIDGDAVHYDADGIAEYYNNNCEPPIFSNGITISYPEEIELSYNGSLSGAPGSAMTSTPNVSNCNGSATYSIVSGSLPAGLSINSSTGVISGTPAAESSGMISVQVSCGGCSSTCDLTYLISNTGTCNEILNETFSSITNGNNTATGGSSTTWNGVGVVNWTVSTAYQAGGVVRLGSSSSVGSLRSPALDLSGPFTVSFDVKGWTNVEGNIRVTISDGQTATATYTSVLSGSFENKTLSFNAATTSSTITIATTAKRAFLDNIVVCVEQLPTCNMSASISGGNSVCSDDDMVLSVTPSNGTAPYSYVWSVSGTNANVQGGVPTNTNTSQLEFAPTNNGTTSANLTYSVTVTDNAGCTATAIKVVTVNSNPVANISGEDYACAGNSITLTASGGTQYNWGSGFSTIASTSVSTSGTYIVTVKDENGCASTASKTITINDNLALSIENSGILTCTNTSVMLTPSISATSYSWSNHATSQSINVTSPGQYSVTITSNGCTGSATVTVNQNVDLPPVNVVNNIGTYELNCTRTTIPVTATSTATSYHWSNGATTVGTSFATAGTYVVTVTAANGCTNTANVVVTQNVDAPTVSITNNSGITELNCTNTSVSVVASGNANSYLWSGNLGTNANATITAAGTYSVTATGANGCTNSASVVVTQNSAVPTLTIVNNTGSTELNCNVNSINVTATSSSTTFSWSTGENTATCSFTQQGTYSVTATSENGCTATSSINITQNIVQPTVTIINNTGTTELNCNVPSISVMATGGIRYLWSDGQETATRNINIQGFYIVLVTSANGCTNTSSISITQDITQPTATITNNSGTDVLTCLQPSISLTASGNGSYFWSQGSISPSINVETAGPYTVTVTGSNGCTNTASVVITQDIMPPTIDIINQEGTTELTCVLPSIHLIAEGGVSYLWSNDNTNESVTVTEAGEYTVSAIGTNGCVSYSTVVITEMDPVLVEISSQPVVCGGGGGSINTSVYGGNAPYTYLWNNGESAENIQNLEQGTYSLTVTDVNGCSVTSNMEIGITGRIAVTINLVKPILCFNDSGATISAESQNGAEPLQYLWNTGCSLQTMENLSEGIYTITITDAWGCEGTTSIAIQNPVADTIVISGKVKDNICYDSKDGRIITMVTGGTAPYTYTWDNGAYGNVNTNLEQGTYHLTVTDALGCSATSSFDVLSPAEIIISADISHVLCHGDMNGSITVNVTGGVAPYDYYMGSKHLSGNRIVHLAEGNYMIVVEDLNGCSASSDIKVFEPEELELNPIVTPPSCIGINDGTVEAFTHGGTEPMTYTWQNRTYDNSVFSKLFAGEYSVTVTDANNCIVSADNIVLPESENQCVRIPNVFTPNGDGSNDQWIIGNIEEFPEAHIYVFNRWGQCLYSGRGADEPWDGRCLNGFVPAGVYIYQVDLGLVNAGHYDGTLTIIY